MLPPEPVTRSSWLESRRLGIGASDASAILGLSPYSTPLEVYLTKVGGADPSAEETESMKLGQLLEPVVAKWYATEKGVVLKKPAAISVHPEHDWLRASLDYVHQNERVILECKSSRSTVSWGEDDTDEVPKIYWIQCQHQMMVTGINFCDLAVLIGGSEFRSYSITHDKGFTDMLKGVLSDFWHKHVLARKPPDPDWSHPTTPSLMSKMYTAIEPTTIELGLQEQRLAKELVFLQETERQTQSKIKEIKARLKEAVGDHRHATLPNLSLIHI